MLEGSLHVPHGRQLPWLLQPLSKASAPMTGMLKQQIVSMRGLETPQTVTRLTPRLNARMSVPVVCCWGHMSTSVLMRADVRDGVHDGHLIWCASICLCLL